MKNISLLTYLDSLYLWLEHRVKGDYQDDKNTEGIKIRMLDDFPLMAPHHSLQSPLVSSSASHLRVSLGQELPQIKSSSQRKRLWGNSINLFALKCYQSLRIHEVKGVTSKAERAEGKTILGLNVPTCLVISHIPLALDHDFSSTIRVRLY